MSCSNPLTRIETTDGKITFTPSLTKDEEATKEWQKKLQNAPNIKSVTLIPCSRCINCRLDKSRDWTVRLMKEAEQYKDNYFVTLTYANEYLPINTILDRETGEIINGFTLCKKDLKKFNKDLNNYWARHKNHQGIRYYECGEYGTENERPHYHAIIFNLPYLDDLKLYKTTDLNNILYTSETLTKIWGKGYVIIGKVTYESASYVARYVMKKQFGKDAEEYYKSKAKIPEFTTMSRMPGIGRNYYEANKEKIYKTDEIYIEKNGKAIKVKPSQYYDKLYEKDNPKKMREIKIKRQLSLERNNQVLTHEMGAPERIQEQREIKARQKQEAIKALKREL